MTDYQIHTLSNGLKIVYQEAPNSVASHIAFNIHVGSRDDGSIPGTAHCFEHMLFKGTKTRNSTRIINRLEIVGGEMNAFTTKEITVIYASVIHQYFERALELLADLTFNSVFPEKELIKEKKVISEEINMYLDTPEENIYDEFQEMVFEGHGLGPNILGNQDSILNINQKTLLDFHQLYYQFENISLSISTSLPFKKIIYLAEKHCQKSYQKLEIPKRDPFKNYVVKSAKKQTEHVQCHSILGNVCYNFNHKNRIPMLLLNNILGGPGMNSRLNLSIREKFGYTYNIESGYSAFYDTGLFHCYLSTEKKHLEKSNQLLKKELQKLKDNKLSPLQLSQYINQFKGQIAMAEENRLNVILALGKNVAQNYEIESLESALKKVEQINSEQLRDIANEIFDFNQLTELSFVSE